MSFAKPLPSDVILFWIKTDAVPGLQRGTCCFTLARAVLISFSWLSLSREKPTFEQNSSHHWLLAWLSCSDRWVCPRIFLQFFGPWLYPPRGTMSLWWRQPKCSRTEQARQAFHKPHMSLSPLSSTGSTGLFDFKQTDKATPLTPAL